MKIKKYMPYIVSGGIAAILLIVVSILALRYQSRYADISRDLNAAESNIRQLADREPFPSDHNIQVLSQNLDDISAQLENVQEWMSEGEIDFDEVRAPNDFMIKLASRLRDLREIADRRGVEMPADFYFSFRRYAEGDMPSIRHVPRLARQLQMIGVVCELLFDGRIESISSIERQEFDAASRDSSSNDEEVGVRGRGTARGAAPQPTARTRDASHEEGQKPEAGYAWEEFKIDFSVREPAFWKIMHTLSTTNLLVSVKDVSFEATDRAQERTRTPGARRTQLGRTSTDVSRSRLGDRIEPRVGDEYESTRLEEADQDAQVEDVPREQRVVAGDGMLRVSMTLHMFRFLDD